MEGMIGEIRLFGGNFAPRSWALCDGQLLSISSNTALFSILGTTYGGDGRSTFALPDLRGRAPIHAGHGPGLSDRRLGAKGGQENVTLTVNQLPNHNHTLTVSSGEPSTKHPKDGFAAVGEYYNATGNATGPANSIGNTGGNQSVSLVQPFLAVNYIICLQGIFPSRG
jgi:microcystin-dependent protein